jgi:hypothetical protein
MRTQLRIFSFHVVTEAFLQASRLQDWTIYAAILHTVCSAFLGVGAMVADWGCGAGRAIHRKRTYCRCHVHVGCHLHVCVAHDKLSILGYGAEMRGLWAQQYGVYGVDLWRRRSSSWIFGNSRASASTENLQHQTSRIVILTVVREVYRHGTASDAESKYSNTSKPPQQAIRDLTLGKP